MSEADPQLVRWRLILGKAAELGLGGGGLEGDEAASDAALSWLYDREAELDQRDIHAGLGRAGGSEGSRLTVPDWINEVHRLFPKETIERLEKDAIERYEINEVVTNPEVLKRVAPNEALLQAVLRTKHLMNPEVLALARNLVAEVVRQLMEKFAQEVKRSFLGRLDPRRSSPLKVARNFDAERTIRKNLRRYSTVERRLYIERPYFLSRTRRQGTKWQVIILVDESGSMLGSVIHAAVTAACLWGLPALRTHLCIFDTQVVDLTPQVTDPIEVLMKVQLGGGTDIGNAVGYGASLIDNPRRAIVVVITDFFEGGASHVLVQRVKALCEQGTYVIGLAALDEAANPSYDRDLARRLADVGAHVGAMTPGQLASWIAEKVRA